jgi:hypothetical protein
MPAGGTAPERLGSYSQSQAPHHRPQFIPEASSRRALARCDGWSPEDRLAHGFVIVLGNFEGTFYRYAKRFEETQSWGPPIRRTIRATRHSSKLAKAEPPLQCS